MHASYPTSCDTYPVLKERENPLYQRYLSHHQDYVHPNVPHQIEETNMALANQITLTDLGQLKNSHNTNAIVSIK
jgi:hypothetical protein